MVDSVWSNEGKHVRGRGDSGYARRVHLDVSIVVFNAQIDFFSLRLENKINTDLLDLFLSWKLMVSGPFTSDFMVWKYMYFEKERLTRVIPVAKVYVRDLKELWFLGFSAIWSYENSVRLLCLMFLLQSFRSATCWMMSFQNISMPWYRFFPGAEIGLVCGCLRIWGNLKVNRPQWVSRALPMGVMIPYLGWLWGSLTLGRYENM